ncbi:MAG: c-type cytochrome [Betaproteobacteria bacterium]|nr:c-type cytochrome [Betaproteobacteria bacterium]
MPHLRPGLALAALAAALALLADPAVAGDRRKSPDGRIDPALLYHNYCSVCHGDQGDGRSRARNSLVPPPADFTDPALRGRLTVDYMAAIIREGKAGTAMVGWKTQLNAAETQALASYVRTRFVEKSGDEASRRGRTLYGHYCAACHGPTGRGIEAGAAREGVKPGPDLTKATGLTRERVIAAIAVGKASAGKPGFAQQLSPADIESVAGYLRQLLAVSPGVSGTTAHGGKASEAKR